MERLQIREISRQLAQTKHMSIGDAERFVTEMFNTIHEGLKHDKQVITNGLGTFKLQVVKEKENVIFTPDIEIARQINAPFENFKTVEITVDIPDESVESETLGVKDEDMKGNDSSDVEQILSDANSTADETQEETPAVEEKVDALTEKVEALTEEIENKKKNRRKWMTTASIIIFLVIAIGGGIFYNQHRIAAEEAAKQELIAAEKAKQAKLRQDSINELKKKIDSIDLTDEEKRMLVGAGKVDAPEYPCTKTLQAAKDILPVGAYTIGGTSNVVEVGPGQTLKDVALENGLPFGEDYVQVHNAVESVKEGQKIRIPLLVSK